MVRKNSPITNGVARMIITYNCFPTKGLICVVKKIYKKAEESTFICILSSSLSSQDISICLKKWAVFVVVRYIIVLCWARQSLHQIVVVLPLGQMGSFSYLNVRLKCYYLIYEIFWWLLWKKYLVNKNFQMLFEQNIASN